MKLTALLPLVGWVGGCLSGCKQQLFPLTWWELKWSAWLNDYDDSELPPLPSPSHSVGDNNISPGCLVRKFAAFSNPLASHHVADPEGRTSVAAFMEAWQTRVLFLTTAARVPESIMWVLCENVCELPRQNVWTKRDKLTDRIGGKGAGKVQLS